MYKPKFNYLRKSLSLVIYLYLGIFFSNCIYDGLVKRPNNKPNMLLSYWLTISLYVIDFFDDKKYYLLDNRPYFAINDIKDKDGNIIIPSREKFIIPVGTLIKIIRIVYPHDNISSSVLGHKDRIWIYVKVAKERGLVNIFDEKLYIIIVPKDIINDVQLREYLAQFLSFDDPNRWMLQTESYIQDAIHHKKPVIGMEKKHIIAALGPALSKHYIENNFIEDQEIWQYHNYVIFFHHDKVNKISSLNK